MLGQTTFDGVPVDSVYTRRTWSGGLPAGVSFNPLFQGKPPGNVISNLALRSTDIGGHFIRMALSVTRGGAYTMAIQSLPLASPFARVFALAVGSIAVAVPLAWLLHVFVEDPVLRARPRIRVALAPARSSGRPGFMRTAVSAILRN